MPFRTLRSAEELRAGFFSSEVYRRIVSGRRPVIVDGGARGSIFHPVVHIPPEHRTLVRFEPDETAPFAGESDEHVIRAALWSEPAHVQLHITRGPACSSIYPPDKRVLSGFIDELGLPAREVDRRLSVPATSIDAALSDAGLPGADFIKLDIHSAEYEALLGARQALTSTTVGVLVECWPLAIHTGQHSFAELDQLMQGAGFVPFDIAVGAWPRKPPVSTRYASRAQSVQLEILYLLDASGSRVSRFDSERVAMLIAFAELFGHVTYALQVVRDAAACEILSEQDSNEITTELTRLNHMPWWRYALSAGARRVSARLSTLAVPVAGR
jgi:FkbM family methyltransferase